MEDPGGGISPKRGPCGGSGLKPDADSRNHSYIRSQPATKMDFIVLTAHGVTCKQVAMSMTTSSWLLQPLLQRSSQGVFRRDSLPPTAVSVVASVTLFFILALVCVALRLWSIRLKMKRLTLALSDYAILFASALAAGYLSLSWLVSERGGLGRPAADLTLSEQKLARKAFIVAWFIQGWANSFVRLSILAFFRQIFPGRRFRTVVTIVQIAVIAYLIAITIGFAAICQPFHRNFDITPEQVEYCGNQSLQFLLSAIFNLALDLIIFTLPMPILWNLQMNTRRKVSLIFVFGLGLFVCFATAWRIHQVVFVSTPSAQREFSASVVGDALWSGLEINLGIINACLPLMPPALQQISKAVLPKALHFSRCRSTKDSKSSPTDEKRVSNTILDDNQRWTRLHNPEEDDNDSIDRLGVNTWIDARPMGNNPKDDNLRLSFHLGVDDWEEQHDIQNRSNIYRISFAQV
ncbi:hypothetical protein F5B22DRAFT_629115 [Xylaria bambusicola]|uniref:uncharacterized protein n=1 Tax=Xylaria bambusicola TaxID=326684 RepID=UPI0020085BE0|nr:uncharacterized protein F5B22DRAFT_629115 [Xylaria bambusicola]KAI0503426.1 hypothetical protein F5B22DRAFT_629115 [Xylaria bambusicola]